MHYTHSKIKPIQIIIMETGDKNIIYTYVPPEIDWLHNKDFYLIDLYSLCVSVKLFKSKFKYKSIKLYTNLEIMEFFKGTEYFDELIDISNCYNVIEKQDTGFSHKNVMFKIFVAGEQVEPFIHMDHDLFINNDNVFDKVDKNILFSFKEPACSPYGNQSTNPYSFYVKIFSDVCKVINDDMLDNFNPLMAYNCSIFGCNNDELILSFQKTKKFLLRNYKKLNKIKDLPTVLEQFIQINYLLDNHKFEDLFVFGDIIKMGRTGVSEIDNAIHSSFDMDSSSLHLNVYNEVVKHFKKSDIVHLSNYRWNSHYRILLVNLLKQLDEDMSTKIESTYGSYKWNTFNF
jgi:hypothetical protein